MLRALSSSVVLVSWGLCAGCGLTLDYDPPEDAGGDVLGMDAPQVLPDGGNGCPSVCAEGTECILGACRHPCESADDCHFDDGACEVCDLAAGACVVAELTCEGGCSPTCDPATDRCAPTCPVGDACIEDSCTTGTPCTGDGDCVELPGNECGPPRCSADGLCEQISPLACPSIDYECATVDACTSCDPIVIADGCSPEELCDIEGGTYQCVQCTATDTSRCVDETPVCGSDGNCRACAEDDECVALRLGNACVSGVCQDCGDDSHCRDALAPHCEPETLHCVECVRSGDCTRPGEVCRADNTCGACANDGDCAAGGTCTAGMCVRPCATGPGACPVTCAGAAISCDGGRCVYASASEDDACSDGLDCTADSCNPSDPRADAFGCLHSPEHGTCDDGVDCTVDRCLVDGPSAMGGCVHTRSDRMCSRGVPVGERRCLDDVCVGRVGADTGPIDGCMPALVAPCGVGEICGATGLCESALGCARCVDDGLACNGVETCVGGALCSQTFGAGGCTGECDQFCATMTTCAPRPGGIAVSCRIAVAAD